MNEPRYPHLSRISIRNYRSIQDVEFDLPSFAVMIGPNGSGKTNMVQGIQLLGEMLARGSTDPVEELGWEEIVRRVKGRAHSIQLGAVVTIPRSALGLLGRLQRRIGKEVDFEFPSDIRATAYIHLKPGSDGAVRIEKELLELECEGIGSLSVVVQDDKCSVERGGDENEFRLAQLLTLRRFPSRKKKEPALFPAHWAKTLENYFDPGSLVEDEERKYLRLLSRPRFFSPVLSYVTDACQVRRVRLDATALRADSGTRAGMGPAGENLAAAVAALRGTREKPKKQFTPILAALQDIFPRVEDIRPVLVHPGRLALSFLERGVKEPFGQASVSDGILHSLAILVALEERGDGLLAIEEPENAIHPWSVRVLMDRVQNHRKRQVILTSHSVEVVNQICDPDALFIVEVDEHGSHVFPARSKEEAIDAILRETGQQLGELWRDGALGGTPGAAD